MSCGTLSTACSPNHKRHQNIQLPVGDSAGCFNDLKQKLEEELLKKKDNGSNLCVIIMSCGKYFINCMKPQS